MKIVKPAMALARKARAGVVKARLVFRGVTRPSKKRLNEIIASSYKTAALDQVKPIKDAVAELKKQKITGTQRQNAEKRIAKRAKEAIRRCGNEILLPKFSEYALQAAGINTSSPQGAAMKEKIDRALIARAEIIASGKQDLLSIDEKKKAANEIIGLLGTARTAIFDLKMRRLKKGVAEFFEKYELTFEDIFDAERNRNYRA